MLFGEIVAPFRSDPSDLSMVLPICSLSVEGVVRVMHPEIGMGVEFLRRVAQQREHLEKFIQALPAARVCSWLMVNQKAGNR